MNTAVTETLNSLEKLDLSLNPYQEAKKLMISLGRFIGMYFYLKKGNVIYRSRLNENNESFYSKCQLTYCPEQFNKVYKRASTPQKTMFYGSYIPMKQTLEKGISADKISILEVLPDEIKDGTTITTGHWILKEEIKLIAIIQSSEFYMENPLTKELMDSYKENLKEADVYKTESLEISEYFAKQFSKVVTEKDFDYEYILSALFSEIYVGNKISGIIYPSVKNNGSAFNIALTPECADTFLELELVVEAKISLPLNEDLIEPMKIVELKLGQVNFELRPLK
jgi:hypothetical protein